MRARWASVAGVCAATAATCVLAQQAAAPPPVPGYLTAQTTPDVGRMIAPPPAEGGPRQMQDLEIFRSTRALEGSDRWRLAQHDNSYAIADLMGDFSCAAGLQMTPETAPKTALLLRRVMRDSGVTANGAKQVFQRKRPYLFVDAPICIAKTDALAGSPDYPSGHSTLSWSVGMILSELAPEHATALMSRARAYGESRIVCGVHTLSAVEAGRFTASAVVAAEHGSAEFRTDMDGARAELAALREKAPTPDAAACSAERALTSKPPY
ncbi:MAG TPA: phosphatase PAP2 family protein [Caulobacteraceae bacterium]|nr:phosphatase PAP2 family protein [Caulobacteraceae bacterium]